MPQGQKGPFWEAAAEPLLSLGSCLRPAAQAEDPRGRAVAPWGLQRGGGGAFGARRKQALDRAAQLRPDP